MNKYGKHNAFMKKVMLYIQETYPGVRLWQQATGVAYTVDSVKLCLKLGGQGRFAEAVKCLKMTRYGLNGAADLSGILPNGKRLEIEIKTGKAVQSKDQKTFMQMIRNKEGIYILITDQKLLKDQFGDLDNGL